MIARPDGAAERWSQVERAFALALDTPPDARDALLASQELDAGAHDEVLRLLARHDALSAGDAAPGFLDALDLARAARLVGADEPGMPATIGRYAVIRVLGRGATGVVYLARDPMLDRLVAVKLLAAAHAADAAAMERFAREARAAAAIDHPHVAPVHEVGRTDDGRHFIAMAYQEGETLRSRIARGPMPVDECVRIADEIADGLAAAHARGIVHRDVKPENILLGERGARIADFGIARVAGDTITRTGAALGTAAYMSPEQTRGVTVDHRSDLWSLGVVLYEMLAGARPFDATGDALVHQVRHDAPPPLRERRPDVPPAIAAVVERCLAKDPAGRWTDAGSLRAALRGDARAPAASRAGRGRAIAVVAAVALLGALGWWRGTAATSPAATNGAGAAAGGAPALALASADSAPRAPARVPDPASYERYLAGRAALALGTRAGLATAAREYREAIARDSLFARPWLGLADVYLANNDAPPAERFLRARELVDRAIALDPTLAEGQRMAAWIAMWYDHDWAAAERHLLRAIALDPRDPWNHHGYAAWLSAVGLNDSSLAVTRRAAVIDPVSTATATHVALHLYWKHRYDEAIAVLERAIANDSSWPRAHAVLGRAYLEAGRHEEAIRELRRMGYEYAAFEPEALLAHALGRAGQLEEARRIAARYDALARGAWVRPVDMVAVRLGLADTAGALDWAERIPDDRGSMFFLLSDPLFDPLRGSPRFARVLARVGLAEAAGRARR